MAVGGGRGGGRDGGKRPLQTGNMRPIDNDNILPTPLLYYIYVHALGTYCFVYTLERDTYAPYAFRVSVESERN